ncbi:MAG: Clp protease N-terminal domain-containing protein, partial [Ktedonobacteraceae bacterium]
KVIELAVDEARRFNHHYIGTEHILLGLIGEGEGIAAGVLESLGVTLDMARTQVRRVLNQENEALADGEGVPTAAEQEMSPTQQRIKLSAHQSAGQGRDRFDKFTERAREVLSLAQEEAQRFQHNYIGTEHLLLGLVREGEGVAAKVLNNLGVELIQVRSAVEFIIGRGDRIVLGEIGLTPRAKKVIELAVDEARRFNHHYIGTEHLLLGLVREGEGIAAGVLESLGVNLEKVRSQTVSVLSQVNKTALDDRDASTPAAPGANTPGQQSETQANAAEKAGISDRMSTGPKSDRDKFDKFTPRSRKVLSMAQEEAQRLQHNYIGTEHLLLGLVRENEGGAAKLLNNLGLDTDKARGAVQFIIGRGDRIVLGEIGLTPHAKQAIELAIDEAQDLNHEYIEPEHILLGIMDEGGGIAVGVLESLNFDLEQLRAETLQVLNPPQDS